MFEFFTINTLLYNYILIIQYETKQHTIYAYSRIESVGHLSYLVNPTPVAYLFTLDNSISPLGTIVCANLLLHSKRLLYVLVAIHIMTLNYPRSIVLHRPETTNPNAVKLLLHF